MKSVILLGSLPLLAVGSLVLAFHPQGPPATAVAATRAANALLETLDANQRKKACFEFKDAERTNWQFVPNLYPGVPLQELGADQKRAVHRLLHAVLSGSGYGKTTAIMRLEDTLRGFAEAAGQKAPHRDPGRYSVALFGKPGKDEPWGFRVQGHHVSWNFASADGRVIATTPAFLGANPAEIRQGPHAGLRALPEEEDLAREFLATLTEAQSADVMLSDKAPRDVLWGPGKHRDVLGEPRGLAWKSMTERQRELVWRLVRTYVGNLAHDLAVEQMKKIEMAGRDGIRFGWMGSMERGKGHYYRITGGTFAIEYDNTQDGANHVHVAWHDLTNDFGVDLLRQHYERHHRK